MSSLELGIIGFAVFMLLMLLVVRAKRHHDQKLRRAASSGFYDFDVAHYGTATAGSSLMEKAVEASSRPLAPSFTASSRGSGAKETRPATATPIPVPSSFGVVDRSPVGPLPTFDQDTARRQRPPVDGGPRPPARPTDADSIDPGLPIPSSPPLPPPPPPEARPDSGSPLPLLTQPPPPGPETPA
jgi:hypothetical protein